MQSQFALLLTMVAAFANADLKLTVQIGMRGGSIPDVVPSSLRKDPKTAAQFRKDLAEDPQTALMMGEPLTIVEWFSGSKERLDIGPATFITTHNPERTIGLDRKERTFRTMPPDPPETASQSSVPSIRDTGITRNILGHVAHEVVVVARGSKGRPLKMRMWVAQDVQNAVANADPLLRQMRPEQRAAFAKVRGCVLRFEMEVDTGEKKPALFYEQVLAVSPEPIPASAFDVPAGYRRYAS